MKFKFLLSIFAFFMVACNPGNYGTYYSFDEKKGEVMLTDLYGLEFSLACSFDGISKKCGVVFSDFTREKSSSHCDMNGCSSSINLSGFKNASILSIQVKNENTGNVQPLISYFQDVKTYIAGDTYVPSVMTIISDDKKKRSEISLNGFYEGDNWVSLAHDTTISIGDTLFANDEGRLDFSVLDKKGSRARLVMNLGKVLKINDGSAAESGNVLEQGSFESYVRDYWVADSGSLKFEPIEVNFDFSKSESCRDNGWPSCESRISPFLHLTNSSNFDELILNGGSNKSSIRIPVVYYAK